MPVSTSSRTSSGEPVSVTQAARASTSRDSSPPDGPASSGAGAAPRLVASRNSTSSMPAGPQWTRAPPTSTPSGSARRSRPTTQARVGQLEEVQRGIDVALEAARGLAASLGQLERRARRPGSRARVDRRLRGGQPRRRRPRRRRAARGRRRAPRAPARSNRGGGAPWPARRAAPRPRRAGARRAPIDVGVAARRGAELAQPVEQVGRLGGEPVEARRRRRRARTASSTAAASRSAAPGLSSSPAAARRSAAAAPASAEALRRRSRSAASCVVLAGHQRRGRRGRRPAGAPPPPRRAPAAWRRCTSARAAWAARQSATAWRTSSRSAGGAGGQVEEVALAALLEQAVAGALEGDLGEHLPHLAQHRLRDQGAVDAAGAAPGPADLAGQGGQLVAGHADAGQALAHRGRGVVEHRADPRRVGARDAPGRRRRGRRAPGAAR